MNPKVRTSSANRFLRLIHELVNWDELEGYLNKATYFQTIEFIENVEQIILDFQIRFQHLIKCPMCGGELNW